MGKWAEGQKAHKSRVINISYNEGMNCREILPSLDWRKTGEERAEISGPFRKDQPGLFFLQIAFREINIMYNERKVLFMKKDFMDILFYVGSGMMLLAAAVAVFMDMNNIDFIENIVITMGLGMATLIGFAMDMIHTGYNIAINNKKH